MPDGGGLCSVPGVSSFCSGVGNAVGGALSSGFDDVVQKFAEGLASVMKTLMTFWLDTPTPEVGGDSSVITTLNEITRPLVGFAALLGVVIGGARLAWAARGNDESARHLMRGLLLMVIVSAAGATIVMAALTGFDALAKYVLDAGFDGTSVGTRFGELAVTSTAVPGGIGTGLLFILCFLAMIASLVQVGIMLVRGAVLALLVGILPIAAAASISDAGWAWFKKLCGWIASFVVYKLAAAVVYATAFLLIGDAKDLVGVVSGFAFLVVAVLALPALLRLIPPSAEAMGGGSGGGMAAGVAALATGAMSLSGRGGGSGSAAPSPTAKPGLTSSAPSGSSMSSGSTSSNGGRRGIETAPVSSGGGGGAGAAKGATAGAGATSSGAGAGAGAAGGAGATGAAGAAGPAGAGAAAALQAGQQAYSGAKTAANNSVEGTS